MQFTSNWIDNSASVCRCFTDLQRFLSKWCIISFEAIQLPRGKNSESGPRHQSNFLIPFRILSVDVLVDSNCWLAGWPGSYDYGCGDQRCSQTCPCNYISIISSWCSRPNTPTEKPLHERSHHTFSRKIYILISVDWLHDFCVELINADFNHKNRLLQAVGCVAGGLICRCFKC